MQCTICTNKIPDGESMWSVNIHKEIANGVIIKVLEAESYWIFCEDCAKERDLSKVTIPMKGEKV